MTFNYENFIKSLEIMAKGMGSIFAVILLLTLIVMLLAKFSGKKKPDKDNED
jgi:Na+-transporting methylmalonyl-CoA/oxaloacetate decarboxylase gamma subunit